jgi:hypothetical protein
MTDPYRAMCAELAEALVDEYAYYTEWEKGLPLCESTVSELLTRARTLLAQPEPAPVAVSERLPGPEDCTAQGRCWVFYRGFATWTLEKPLGQDGKHTGYTHWLPANALPTPEAKP